MQKKTGSGAIGNPFELNCVAGAYDMSVARRDERVVDLESDGLVFPGTFGSSGGENFLNLLKRMRTYAAEDDALLEVGCGTGAFFEVLRKNGFSQEYTGIDASHEHIQRAKAMYPGATFAVGDICNLSFEDDHFGFVFENNVFPFIVEPERAVCEMVRVSNRFVSFRAHTTSVSGGIYCYQPLYTIAETEKLPNGMMQCFLPDDLDEELRPERVMPNVMRELADGKVKVAVAKVPKRFIDVAELDTLVASLNVDVVVRNEKATSGFGAIMTEELTRNNSREALEQDAGDCRITERDVLLDVTAQDVEFVLCKC